MEMSVSILGARRMIAATPPVKYFRLMIMTAAASTIWMPAEITMPRPERKAGMGILYIFTLGLFGIGALIDLINILLKPNPYYVH